jgi:hypothetical protein
MTKEGLVPPGYPTRFMKRHPHVIIDKERAHLMAHAEDPYQTMARYAKEARLGKRTFQTLKDFAYGAAQQTAAQADGVPTVVYVNTDSKLSHIVFAAPRIANLLIHPDMFKDTPLQITDFGLQQKSSLRKIRGTERAYRTKHEILPPDHPQIEKKLADIYALTGGGEKKEIPTERTDEFEYLPQDTQTFITDTPLGIRIREVRYHNVVKLYAEIPPQDSFI